MTDLLEEVAKGINDAMETVETADRLQHIYDAQAEEHSSYSKELLDKMSRHVAWTIIPGRDRQDCPDDVDLWDARLVTLDRFPGNDEDVPRHAALGVYHMSVARSGTIRYGGSSNCEMFKDLSYRPFPGGTGLCLDADNRTIFKLALALNWAIEQAALGRLKVDAVFSPPRVHFAFRDTYTIEAEWRPAMMDAIKTRLRPEGPPLRCFVTSGGKVSSVSQNGLGFIKLVIDGGAKSHTIEVPTWAKIVPGVEIGAELPEGALVADLPRGDFISIAEITKVYAPPALWWLQRRIIEDVTREIQADSVVVDRETNARELITLNYRCAPAELVRGQVGRADRYFLDMRGELASSALPLIYDDCSEEMALPTRVHVQAFPSRPSYDDALFFSKPDKYGTIAWMADLMSLPENASWARNAYTRTAKRGCGAL